MKDNRKNRKSLFIRSKNLQLGIFGGKTNESYKEVLSFYKRVRPTKKTYWSTLAKAFKLSIHINHRPIKF